MAKTLTKFETNLSAKEGFHIHSTLRNHTLEIDEPKELGGTDKGPNPVELVLAALGSCQEIVLKFYGQKLGIEILSVETTVDGNIDLGGFLGTSKVRPGFQSINATTKLKAKGDSQKITELLKLAEERCPVLDIIKNGVPVKAIVQTQ